MDLAVELDFFERELAVGIATFDYGQLPWAGANSAAARHVGRSPTGRRGVVAS